MKRGNAPAKSAPAIGQGGPLNRARVTLWWHWRDGGVLYGTDGKGSLTAGETQRWVSGAVPADHWMTGWQERRGWVRAVGERMMMEGHGWTTKESLLRHGYGRKELGPG